MTSHKAAGRRRSAPSIVRQRVPLSQQDAHRGPVTHRRGRRRERLADVSSDATCLPARASHGCPHTSCLARTRRRSADTRAIGERGSCNSASGRKALVGLPANARCVRHCVRENSESNRAHPPPGHLRHSAPRFTHVRRLPYGSGRKRCSRRRLTYTYHFAYALPTAPSQRAPKDSSTFREVNKKHQRDFNPALMD